MRRPISAHLLVVAIIASTAAAFDPYYYIDGVLGGFDALPPASVTLAAARAACDASDGCFGFSCEGAVPPPPPEAALPCVFRSASAAGARPGWQSFVRCGVLSPCPPAPPCAPGAWASANGFLADGGDALPPAPSTFADAQRRCASTAGCLGITFSANASEPEGVIPTVYFKNQTSEVDDAAWWTWLLCPAAAAVTR
jgi:hypothetical protein